jgi:hypothetical protein
MTEFFNRTIENLRQGPLGPVVRWVEAHPRLSAWFVLALGMDILLVIEARDVGLLPHQWASLIIATTLVAGLCVWIISWEDETPLDEEEAAAEQQKATAEAAPETAKAAPKKRTRKPKTPKE